jgi:hypothetical protein
MKPSAWVPTEEAAEPCAAGPIARGVHPMLTLTLVLMGVAMVMGSVALVGLCVLQEPPLRGGPPPGGCARRPAR